MRYDTPRIETYGRVEELTTVPTDGKYDDQIIT